MALIWSYLSARRWPALLLVLACLTVISYSLSNAYVSRLAYSHPVIKTMVVTKYSVRLLTQKHVEYRDRWVERPDGTKEHERIALDTTTIDSTKNGQKDSQGSSTPSVLADRPPQWAGLATWEPFQGTIKAGLGVNLWNWTLGLQNPLPVVLKVDESKWAQPVFRPEVAGIWRF